jgi:hypothetical protein
MATAAQFFLFVPLLLILVFLPFPFQNALLRQIAENYHSPQAKVKEEKYLTSWQLVIRSKKALVKLHKIRSLH